MELLLDELLARGLLDAGAAEWARSYATVRSASMDTSLLELDLVDEQDLLRGLQACVRAPEASPEDFSIGDPDILRNISTELHARPSACPVRWEGDTLIVLVSQPLPEELVSQVGERGLRLSPRVATTHAVTLARATLYRETLDERTKALELRLARRRDAPEVGQVLEAIATAQSLSVATAEALAFAGHFLDFCCLLMTVGDEVRVLASGNPELAPRTSVAAPHASCSFAAALRFGGYFVGSLGASDAERDFFDSLGRPTPRWAFVAPVPLVEGRSVAFFGDNGQRGMATRWIAKLTLAVSRLGQQASRLGVVRSNRKGATAPQDAGLATSTPQEESPAHDQAEEPAEAEAPADAPQPSVDATALQLTAGEVRALARLRRQADEEGVSVERLVDALLRERAPQAVPEATALLGEVRGLFEQLTSSLPTQFARGIESALRDLSPRAPAPAQPVARAALPEPRPEPPAAAPQLSEQPEAPRDVPSYRSRRAKTSRVKL